MALAELYVQNHTGNYKWNCPCLKKIYNLVIDLFMTYLRSSLAAAGHVQAPLAFTAFFLISQANFPRILPS